MRLSLRLATACLAWLAAVAGLLCAAAPAQAAGTRAGTEIVNVARASYLQDGVTPTEVDSNESRFRVDEIIDLTVVAVGAQPVPVLAGDSGRALLFLLTNSGNGEERFRLQALTTIGGDSFDPVLATLAPDRDNDGRYDPLIDLPYTPGPDDPLLPPDGSSSVFVVVDIPAATADGDLGTVALGARAETGTGPPGTSFAGQGAGGGDAVLGVAGGDDDAQGTVRVSSATPQLSKAAVVSDPAGGDRPMPGAVVQYRLTADLRATYFTNPVITDPIPAGTSYVGGSLRLNGAVLSDAADSDPGEAAPDRISVRLDPSRAEPSLVTFDVRINE